MTADSSALFGRRPAVLLEEQARVASLRTSFTDPRFDPGTIAEALRALIEAWGAASRGRDRGLRDRSTPDAMGELLFGDGTVPGAIVAAGRCPTTVERVRVTALDSEGMTVAVEATGFTARWRLAPGEHEARAWILTAALQVS